MIRFCTDQTSVFNVFLTEVIICSFNNNTLQKWTNGKAFNIMASAQFFPNIIYIWQFQDIVCTFQWWSFTINLSLQQVNGPNSWDMFQKCCTDIRFLPNFAVFCGFLWILRLCNQAKYQKPCLYYYMRNFCNLIGLDHWCFSLIWNTYMWKLQNHCG